MTTRTLNITDAAIKRHAADSAVRQLRDQSVGKLYLRYHRSRCSGTWYLVDNRQWQRKGRWPEISATIMRREAPALLANADRDMEADKTLADILTWFRQRTELNRTITSQRRSDILSVIDNHLMPADAVMALPVKDIQRRDLDDGLMLPLQQRLAPGTVAKAFRILKMATKRAARLDVIGYDPLSAYRLADFLRQTAQPKAAALRASDLDTVAQALVKANTDARMLALVMLLHGTRINETRLSAWRWVDLEDGWWEIPAAHTKNGRAHRLPLTTQAAALFHWYRQYSTGTHLFQNSAGTGPVSRTQAYRMIRSISHQEWASHDLRKLARTIWADLGVEWWVGELLINHTPSKMDRTYIHTLVDQQCREALQQYHDWLETRSDTFAQLMTDVRASTPIVDPMI